MKGSLLRRRDFASVTASVGVSSLGDFVAWIALMLLVRSMTGSGIAVSAVVLCVFGPIVLFAPWVGLLVDRFETVRLIVVMSLLQAVMAAALAFQHHLVPVLILTFLLGTGGAIGQAAEFTLVPIVAGEDRLSEANGWVETARYFGLIGGPILGGLLAAGGGVKLALLIDAASFLFVALVIATVKARRRPVPGSHAADPDSNRAREGFVHLWRDRTLALTTSVATIALVFMSISIPADVFFAHDVLHAGDVGYGALVTVWGAGMVAGAVGLARRVSREWMVTGALVAIFVQGLGKPIAAIAATLGVALLGYAIGGLGHGMRNVLIRTLMHERTPDRLRGRTFAAFNALRNTAELVALAVGGVLVTAAGARTTLIIAGAGPVVFALAGLALNARRPPEPTPEVVA
jgi:MFS family permease